jgi:hypothetical protein
MVQQSFGIQPFIYSGAKSLGIEPFNFLRRMVMSFSSPEPDFFFRTKQKFRLMITSVLEMK